MKKVFFILFLLPSVVVMAQKNVQTKFAKTITAADLKKHLYTIAGPEMEGRETATDGQKKAAAYIENNFKALGLLPGNKDSYQMNFAVFADSASSAAMELNGQTYTYGTDFSANTGSNVPATYRFSEIVFAGAGISDDTQDDYKNLDVKGKLVMVFGNLAPKNSNRKTTIPAKVEAAKKNGAAAILFINAALQPAQPGRRGGMYINGFKKSLTPQQFFIGEKIAKEIMGDEYDKAMNESLAAKVYGVDIMLQFDKKSIVLQSSNVLGVIEGSDKKDEYVFITAHYDHLGKRDTVIYYGADDDGSGTVSVLELAEAFAKAKAAGKGPRRNIVFMTVSGEEKGLWGSEIYGNRPIFPLDKTTVDLNVDMIGRIGEEYTKNKLKDSINYVYVIGDDKLSSDLKPISEMVNNKFTKLKLDYKYNDPKDPNRFYYRSDHYNFAEKGVPIIFYFNGVHKDYHRPTDTPDKINYELMAKRAQLVFYTAWEMANRDEMLKRDIPLQKAGF
jgi:Peptidase family M28/PA domain